MQNPVSSRRWYQFSLRGLLVGVTLLAVAIGCVLALIPVWQSLKNPLDFGGRKEFARLKGPAARRAMNYAWPQAVDPKDVEVVSYKSESTRDGHSSWTRVRLTPAAAEAWADDVHAYQERDVVNSSKSWEGIRRTLIGPAPLHRQTGSTPSWWLPPGSDVRATEAMLWYDQSTGIARATYSSFHPETKTLWIYAYACQHDKLWDKGKPPEGTPIQRPGGDTE